MFDLVCLAWETFGFSVFMFGIGVFYGLCRVFDSCEGIFKTNV